MQNVKTIDIKGKPYVTVAERVRQVHLDEKNGFQVLESTPLQVGDRWLWRAVIEVGGRRYIGTAEVHLDAPKSLPEGKSPFETGETSAIGRALGFPGYGLVESIASADEMVQNERASSYDPDAPCTEQQLDTIDKLRAQLGMQSLASTDGLTFGDCASMLKDLNKRLQSAKRAS